MNTSNLPEIEINYLDKIGHFFCYALLAFLVYKSGVEMKLGAPIIWAIVVPTVYGILLEFAQGYFSALRIADGFDALANALGAIFVGFLLYLRR